VLFCGSNSFSRCYKNCTFIIPIADIRLTSVIRTYRRHLNLKTYICSTMFCRMTLGANGVANKLFLTFLFSDPDVSVLFLKDVWQIRSNVVCCKCGSQISWCGDTNPKDGYRCRCQRITLLPQALLPRQSDTVHGFSREFNEGFVPHLRRRSLVRT
jgi:hypothetical protein